MKYICYLTFISITFSTLSCSHIATTNKNPLFNTKQQSSVKYNYKEIEGIKSSIDTLIKRLIKYTSFLNKNGTYDSNLKERYLSLYEKNAMVINDIHEPLNQKIDINTYTNLISTELTNLQSNLSEFPYPAKILIDSLSSEYIDNKRIYTIPFRIKKLSNYTIRMDGKIEKNQKPVYLKITANIYEIGKDIKIEKVEIDNAFSKEMDNFSKKEPFRERRNAIYSKTEILDEIKIAKEKKEKLVSDLESNKHCYNFFSSIEYYNLDTIKLDDSVNIRCIYKYNTYINEVKEKITKEAEIKLEYDWKTREEKIRSEFNSKEYIHKLELDRIKRQERKIKEELEQGKKDGKSRLDLIQNQIGEEERKKNFDESYWGKLEDEHERKLVELYGMLKAAENSNNITELNRKIEVGKNKLGTLSRKPDYSKRRIDEQDENKLKGQIAEQERENNLNESKKQIEVQKHNNKIEALNKKISEEESKKKAATSNKIKANAEHEKNLARLHKEKIEQERKNKLEESNRRTEKEELGKKKDKLERKTEEEERKKRRAIENEKIVHEKNKNKLDPEIEKLLVEKSNEFFSKYINHLNDTINILQKQIRFSNDHIKILNKKFEDVNRNICRSYLETMQYMPSFPFPPPKASQSRVINREFFKNSSTLTNIAGILSLSLDSCGYSERSYFQIPGGFALVTGMEEIRVGNDTFEIPNGWNTSSEPKETTLGKVVDFTTILDYFNSLFFNEVYTYRIMVLLVTDVPFNQATNLGIDDARTMVNKGNNILNYRYDLPKFTAKHNCTALVYEYNQKERNADILYRKTSSENSKILNFSQKK